MVRMYREYEIDYLANILKNNGVISVPTDTVYGLCCSTSSKEAYEKLIILKERPKNKLFPVMCKDYSQINDIAVVNSVSKKIIDVFMPGAITLILKKKANVLSYIKSDTIAIRMATSNFLKDLIDKVGYPLFMTSANKSGMPVCNSLDEIESTFLNIDAIVKEMLHIMKLVR